MQEKLDYTRQLPIRDSVDVFVAGGGPAGMAAAVTAARAGAKVFLVETLGGFGGMGTSAGIPFICRPTDGIHFLAGGFGREVYDRLFRSGGAGPEMRYGSHPSEIGGFIYNPESLKRVYDEMAAESGMDFTFHTSLIDLQMEGNRVTHAICAAKSGVFAIKAGVFIDATGDGDLAAMAGAPVEFGDEEGLAQAATLCSLWSGIDWSRKEIWTDGKALKQAYHDGVFSERDTGLPGILHTVADSGWGNVGHVYGIDARDERTVTRGMIQGRKLALEYERYYWNYVPGCENAHMLWTSLTLGIGNPAGFSETMCSEWKILSAGPFSRMRSDVTHIRLICTGPVRRRIRSRIPEPLSSNIITIERPGKVTEFPIGSCFRKKWTMFFPPDVVSVRIAECMGLSVFRRAASSPVRRQEWRRRLLRNGRFLPANCRYRNCRMPCLRSALICRTIGKRKGPLHAHNACRYCKKSWSQHSGGLSGLEQPRSCKSSASGNTGKNSSSGHRIRLQPERGCSGNPDRTFQNNCIAAGIQSQCSPGRSGK